MKENTDYIKEVKMKEILKQLHSATSRESGIRILSAGFKTRASLKKFARHIDVYVSDQDSLVTIMKNIVEATIGARLNSDVIRKI